MKAGGRDRRRPTNGASTERPEPLARLRHTTG